MKRNYELAVILDSEVKAEEQEETVSRVKKIISNANGELISSKDWGKKEFAYPVNKKLSGVYFLFEYAAEPQTVASVKQKLQLEEKIIRYLLTVVEEKSQAPEKKGKGKGGKNVIKIA